MSSAPKSPPKTLSHGSQGSTRSPDVTRQASIVGLFGATGTGKSTTVKRSLAGRPIDRPVIVFDAGHEYADPRAIVTADETKFLQLCGATSMLVFRPSFDTAIRARQFNRFCAAGLSIARARSGCLIVAEELHTVTSAGAAPQYWRELITTGRKYGAGVIATATRPALIDKSFWSACTLVRTGRLNYIEDQRTLAGCLGVDAAAIAQLAGQEYIERDLLAGTPARTGRLTFDRSHDRSIDRKPRYAGADTL